MKRQRSKRTSSAQALFLTCSSIASLSAANNNMDGDNPLREGVLIDVNLRLAQTFPYSKDARSGASDFSVRQNCFEEDVWTAL